MKELFTVDSICDGKITVFPCCSGSIHNGGNSSAETGFGKKYHIEAFNPKALQLTEGCRVYITISKNFEAARGIAAVLLPVATAASGFLCSPILAAKIQREPTEIFKAVCTSACFLIAAALVFLISRNMHTAIRPTIIAVCKEDGNPRPAKTTI